MKNPAWLGLMVLLAISCRKESVVETASAPPTAAGKEVAAARVGAPSAPTTGEEATENARSRPLPRPEDPKHKPAPPVEQPVPTAVAVQDKPGFVFSPYNSKIVDVRDIPPGTLVADPNFSTEEKKYFRVP